MPEGYRLFCTQLQWVKLRVRERRMNAAPWLCDNTVRTIIARVMNILGINKPVFPVPTRQEVHLPQARRIE